MESDLQFQTQILADYINTPDMQSYMNKSIMEPQALYVLKQLCQQKSILKISQKGTNICKFCNLNIHRTKELAIDHFCQSSLHAKCIKQNFLEINPNFVDNINVMCPHCNMEIFPEQVQESFGGVNIYNQQKNQSIQVDPCMFCKQKIVVSKQKSYLTHFCDKNVHVICLQKEIYDKNPQLDPQVIIQCPSCPMEFVNEQIWQAFGSKEEYQKIREQIDQEYIQKIQLEMKQQRSKEAKERNFECEICMGEANINDDCRTLDHCLHQFCEECLREHIRASKNNGKIECPLCQDIPVEERKFPDPKHGKDYVHDPNNIEISLIIVKDLLPKDEFMKLEELWTTKFYKTGNDKIILLQCPGYQKKILNQDADDKEKKIDKKVLQDMLKGKIQNLGFEFINCTAMYELNIEDDKLNNHQCGACGLEFCPKCKDQGHNGTCEEYKKWKIENEKSDEALENLLKTDKNIRKCPKCFAMIMKASGCNRVPCANKKCGTHICWVCMDFFPTSGEGYTHIDKKHPGKLWTE